MPTYDYVCGKCGDTIEVYQTFQEAPLKRHRGGCGGKLTRVLAPVGVVLKGSGFYKTDSKDSARSKSKARSTEGAAKSSKDTSDSKSSDSKSSESKSSESKSTSAAKSEKKSSGSGSKASKSG